MTKTTFPRLFAIGLGNMRTLSERPSRHLSKLALCFGAAVALAAPAHAGMISDGGFESAVPGIYGPGAIGDGWTVLTGAIGIINSGEGLGAAYDGVNYADLDQGLNVNALGQTVATTVGESYTVSFWLGDDAGSDPVVVNFGGNTLLNANTPPGLGFDNGYQYQLYSYVVTATSASSFLDFVSVYNSPNPSGGIGAVIDDVNVTPTPEPATWTAMLIGLVGLGIAGAWRRRATAVRAR
jgi:MYXO-CTERM domain-containing protein